MQSSPPLQSSPAPTPKIALNGNQHSDSSDDEAESEEDVPLEYDSDGNLIGNCIRLCREEDLTEAQAAFTQPCGKPTIYSVEPASFRNLELLAQVNREASAAVAAQDPVVMYPRYGLIVNPRAKRRSAYVPPDPSTLPVTEQPLKPPFSNLKRQDTSSSIKTDTSTDSKSSLKNIAKPARKCDSTSFFGTSSTTKKPKPAPTTEPASATRTPKSTPKPGAHSGSLAAADMNSRATIKAATDVAMADLSDPEPTDEPPAPAVSKADAEQAEARRRERDEKRRKLAAMMDESDEEMGDAPPAASAPEEDADVDVDADADADADWPASRQGSEEAPVSQPAATPAATATTTNGRRRGRRQVVRKKQYTDEDGMMVTRSEPVWESFSEEEPAPVPKLRRQESQPSSSAGTAKGKVKGGAKAGPGPKGKINSFFSKK